MEVKMSRQSLNLPMPSKSFGIHTKIENNYLRKENERLCEIIKAKDEFHERLMYEFTRITSPKQKCYVVTRDVVVVHGHNDTSIISGLCDYLDGNKYSIPFFLELNDAVEFLNKIKSKNHIIKELKLCTKY
jgi:hypothetical protein